MKLKFAKGGKPEYPEKNPRNQIEIEKAWSWVVEVAGVNDDRYTNLILQCSSQIEWGDVIGFGSEIIQHLMDSKSI